jgi:hypothetical protein
MPAKLPVLGLVGEALRDVFGNLAGLVRIAWPYYALAAALVLAGALLASEEPDGTPTLTGAVAPALGGGTAVTILSLCALACIVRWQRHVILGEPLRGIAPLNGRVLRYFLWSVALGLSCAVPLAAAGLAGFSAGLITRTPAGETPYAVGMPGLLLLGAAALVALALFIRLSLVLPAVSADDRSMSLRRSWAATRGNGLRLLGVMVLLALGLGLLGMAAGLLQAALDTAAGGSTGPLAPTSLGGAAANAALDLLTAVIGASVAAGIYRRLAPASPG